MLEGREESITFVSVSALKRCSSSADSVVESGTTSVGSVPTSTCKLAVDVGFFKTYPWS